LYRNCKPKTQSDNSWEKKSHSSDINSCRQYKIKAENITNNQNWQRSSPLGRTATNWKFENKTQEGINLQHIPNAYKNIKLTQKETMAYTEENTDRLRGSRRQNNGVRISGRRFTAGYKRKLTKGDCSYEADEVYKNRTSNNHNLAKLAEIVPSDLNSKTPGKQSKTNIFRVKPGSSHTKKRFTIHAPTEPTSTHHMDPKYHILTGSALKTEVAQSSTHQYMKSASLCQFHK
jgi:hypothetical protein